MATIADDSGLEVDALGNEPGVRSARYCGRHGDDEANNDMLLQRLANIPQPRTARFICVIALARPGMPVMTAAGVCEGSVLLNRRGNGGFGYDPLFLPEGCDKTFAEMNEAEKHAVSHRAKAIDGIVEALRLEQNRRS